MLPRVLPFVVLLIGVMVALYGGYATPSETAGLGALLAMGLIAIVYRVWRPRQMAPFISATIKESTMLLFIIGMSLLYSYVMSYLNISQSAAQWVVGLHLSKWLLLMVILAMVIVFGFFLPPVSIILMIKNIAPDFTLKEIIWGVFPFLGLMLLAVILLCVFPQIATAFPDSLMGVK